MNKEKKDIYLLQKEMTIERNLTEKEYRELLNKVSNKKITKIIDFNIIELVVRYSIRLSEADRAVRAINEVIQIREGKEEAKQ